MTTTRREQIVKNIEDKESRDYFVEEHISTSIPFQIRAIRESLSKTQKQLAKEMSTGQSVISQLENPDYGNFTLNTLKKIASIFDVALIVKFAPFSELVDSFINLDHDKIAATTYSKDTRLHGSDFHTDNVSSFIWLEDHPIVDESAEAIHISQSSHLHLYVQEGNSYGYH